MQQIKKLAIITTHPIQYYAPIFQLLAKQVNIKVFYTWGEKSLDKYDRGFNQKIKWDLPLLEGYDFEFLENASKKPGSHHFNGVINPNAIEKIKSYQPDAILIYGWAYASHLKIIRHFKGKIPIYFRGDSTLLDAVPSLKNFIKKLFLTRVYKKIDFAFYVGKANKAYFKNYGLTEKQLIFAPHAIDNDRFGIDKKTEADEIRKKLGINDTDKLILFAGKLETKKNPELLLQAFIELNLPNTHLLFVGNGELEESLKLKVKNLSFNFDQVGKFNKIHFMDFQNQMQMPTIYQTCDLFCLPSKGPGETWGLAVNEAMAAGKAVLVSDKVGCAIDLVTPEVGAIFKNGDLSNLTQKLIALTSSKNQLLKMGKTAQKHIQNWNFKTQSNTIASHVNR